jgi:chromate transporter
MGGGEDATAESESKSATTRRHGDESPPDRLVEIARFFLKIGLVGFGGPLVHIAMMEDELVGEGSREWTDERTFMDGLAVCNTLPGPASTQLGIFMGWIRGGNLGAVVAGAAFMLPTFVVVVALSYLYFEYGTLPARAALFYGVNPVVIGLVLGASYRLARGALKEGSPDVSFTVAGDEWTVDFVLLALLGGALVATVVVNPNPVLEFAIAAAVAVAVYRPGWVRENAGRLSVGAVVAGGVVLLATFRQRVVEALSGISVGSAVVGSLLAAGGALWANAWIKLFGFMLYVGSFIYGVGLVLIPFIEKYVVVEFGWMSAGTFLDGVAIGQLTPGPVVMTTAFVGYELMLDRGVAYAVLGAFVAALGAFLPSFVFVVIGFPYVARVRENDVIQIALAGVNAAVVGAIAGATVGLADEAFVDAFTVALGTVTFVLFVRGESAIRLILGGGAAGLAAYYLL